VLAEALDSAPRQVLRELAWRRLLVNALAVRTDYWRRGIGRQLLGAAEAWGQERGARLAVLDTYLHSPVSVPFYEQGMGYRRQSLSFSKSLTGLADASAAAARASEPFSVRPGPSRQA
jgi:GNAT superfamily N-acetyltransferase